MTRLPALLVPVLFAFQSLVIGENCPAPIDVEARVRTILHLTPEQELNEGFAVERHEAGLYVELRSADSTVIGQRTLPAEGNCDELAQAAAVVLATWLSDVHPDFAGALPPAEASPPPEPKPEPVVVPPPKPPPPKPAAPPAVARNAWELALGIGSDLSAGQPTLAGYLGGRYGARADGFGLTAIVVPTLSRREPLDSGAAVWRRWPFGVGPDLRLTTGGAAWDVNAGPALAWLHLTSTGLPRTSPKNGVTWGGFLNLRVASRGRPWGVFGLLNLQVYPAQTSVYATNVAQRYALPSFGLGLAVGVILSP
jgi:hypothetical protein